MQLWGQSKRKTKQNKRKYEKTETVPHNRKTTACSRLAKCISGAVPLRLKVEFIGKVQGLLRWARTVSQAFCCDWQNARMEVECLYRNEGNVVCFSLFSLSLCLSLTMFGCLLGWQHSYNRMIWATSKISLFSINGKRKKHLVAAKAEACVQCKS